MGFTNAGKAASLKTAFTYVRSNIGAYMGFVGIVCVMTTVAYSQGFHPHPLIKFGPPLPVGVEGEHELLDLCLTHLQNGWVRNLAGNMPSGVRIHRVEMVGVSAPEAIDRSVDRMDYRIVLPAAAEARDAAPNAPSVARHGSERLS